MPNNKQNQILEHTQLLSTSDVQKYIQQKLRKDPTPKPLGYTIRQHQPVVKKASSNQIKNIILTSLNYNKPGFVNDDTIIDDDNLKGM